MEEDVKKIVNKWVKERFVKFEGDDILYRVQRYVMKKDKSYIYVCEKNVGTKTFTFGAFSKRSGKFKLFFVYKQESGYWFIDKSIINYVEKTSDKTSIVLKRKYFNLLKKFDEKFKFLDYDEKVKKILINEFSIKS